MNKLTKRVLSGTFAALLGLSLTACGASSSGTSTTAESGGTIVIGSKDFTENEVVAEVYALALEDAGYTVERKMDIASSVIHTSIVNKEIDLKQVQQLLGHKDPATTMKFYAGVSEEQQRRTVEGIEKLLG